MASANTECAALAADEAALDTHCMNSAALHLHPRHQQVYISLILPPSLPPSHASSLRRAKKGTVWWGYEGRSEEGKEGRGKGVKREGSEGGGSEERRE